MLYFHENEESGNETSLFERHLFTRPGILLSRTDTGPCHVIQDKVVQPLPNYMKIIIKIHSVIPLKENNIHDALQISHILLLYSMIQDFFFFFGPNKNNPDFLLKINFIYFNLICEYSCKKTFKRNYFLFEITQSYLKNFQI